MANKEAFINVLAIGDPHEPFTHKHYLEFCKQTQKKFKCSLTIHMGDAVDNHAISYHEHDPDGKSHGDELKLARKRLKKWFKAFPRVKLVKGNHDRLVERKALTHGLSKEVIKPYRDIWELPKTWEYEWNYKIQGVLYSHGDGYSGMYAHGKFAKDNFCSSVIGHLHANGGTIWGANHSHIYFGLATGCGIDSKSYAMAYGKSFTRKLMLGCGVVTENGRYAQFIPMKL